MPSDLVGSKRPFGSPQIDAMPDAHSIDAATFPAAINGNFSMAPTQHAYELDIDKGDPLWVYKPHVQFLIGGVESQVLLNLQLLNHGLAKKKLDQERMMPVDDEENFFTDHDALLYAGYPETVNDLLRDIPAFGAFGSNRSKSQITRAMDVVGQIMSEITRVPLFWPGVVGGDRVGFRVGLVNLENRPVQSPRGDVIDAMPLSKPVLQVTPFVMRRGMAPHGTGDMNDYKKSLDFRQEKVVEQFDVELSDLGIPTRRKISEPVSRKATVRAEGKYIHFGTVMRTRGPDPSDEEIEEAIRSIPARIRLQATSSCDIALSPDQCMRTF